MDLDAIPNSCLKIISSFLTPSEQDLLIDITILSMDDCIMCNECDVNVSAWGGRCYQCHMNKVCPECCLVKPKGIRYYHSIGVYNKIPNVCESCYMDDIPYFCCFFCIQKFYALDGYRIVVETDNKSYDQVICSNCVSQLDLERWNHQWISSSIRPSTYGAKLWDGPALPLPYNIDQFRITHQPALLLFMQQSKNTKDLMK